MKKITMMAACFALLLSSCVTNEESASVTNIRDAKAEHLNYLVIAALHSRLFAVASVVHIMLGANCHKVYLLGIIQICYGKLHNFSEEVWEYRNIQKCNECINTRK